jgi:hypothetical protein
VSPIETLKPSSKTGKTVLGACALAADEMLAPTNVMLAELINISRLVVCIIANAIL